jgi:hypothetical protein
VTTEHRATALTFLVNHVEADMTKAQARLLTILTTWPICPYRHREGTQN